MKKSLFCLYCVIAFAFLLFVFLWDESGFASAASGSGSCSPAASVSGNDAAEIGGCTEAVIQLQVPENINFVIDPWEIAGQGQVYSGKYAIKNCGTQEGILYLTDIACFTEESGSVVLTEDESAVSCDEGKNIYMELLFEDGETLTLSQTEQEYCIRLAPGEEIVFWISGAVNDKRREQWKNNDVIIKMTYRFRAEAQ